MKKFPTKEVEPVYKARVKFEPSIYQKKIYKDLHSGVGHTIIEAYAGSGKTSSLVEGIKYIPKGKKVLLLAFNKSIQTELKERVSAQHEVLTFHSCGFRAIKQRFGEVVIDEFKVQNIVSKLVDEKDRELIDNLVKAISHCKNSLVDTPSKIELLINKFSIDTCGMELEEFIPIVVKALALNKKQTNTIDFDDMCLYPYIFNLNLGTYDYVFCDEYQDVNTAGLSIAMKACNKNGGRIIACGDKYQNLYASFRGTDDSIIGSLKQKEGAKTLTLPISYRCPTKILDLCRYWVKDIQAAPNAKEGHVEDISLNQLYDKASPGCFIISRTNAPLIKICMQLISRGKKANIKGRDIGNQLSYIIKRSKTKEVPAFVKWLEKWKIEELEKCEERKFNPENTLDRFECLMTVANDCSSIKEMINKIDNMFNDVSESNVIILSSTHKSKGLETDNVFVLKWTYGAAWLDEQTKYVDYPSEAHNLSYVAISRSKKNLYIVHKTFSQDVP